MAWTSKSTRFVAAKDDANPVVGPGSYAAPQRRRTEPSYAPFGSDRARSTSEPVAEGAPERFPVPAPGDYDPKLPGKYSSGLPRKSAPFLTSAPRASPAAATKPRPGPGAYEAPEGWRAAETLRVEACRTMGVPQKEVMFHSASAPSIPRGHQCFGYEERDDGRLVRQPPKNASQLLAGRGAETAGPGHYDVGTWQNARNAQNATKALGEFGKGPPRKIHKVVETPGPDHYMVRSASRGPGPLSSLASGTERLVLKDNGRPGPGAYMLTGPGPKSLRELNPELQFFCSTAERLPRNLADGVPGPGRYEHPSKRNARPPAETSFGVSDRFEGPRSQAAAWSRGPGPGAYDSSASPGTSGVLGTASVLASTGALAFGSMQSRQFGGANEGIKESPGPGNYEASPGLSSPPPGQLRTGRASPPNAIFASGSAKNTLMTATERQAEKVPPVGSYTPLLARDTSPVMRLPPKSEGFLSAAPRSDSFSKAQPGPGPGNYTPADLTCGKRLGTHNRAVVEGFRGGFGFGHTGKRFNDKPAVDTPGPGAHEAHKSKLVSKSHNVHFGDDAI